MRNMLVTGGAGFIGSNFIHFINKTNPDIYIVNLDALTYAGNLKNLENLPHPENYTFIHGNICDRALVESLFQQYDFRYVVHFAAETHVDRSIQSGAPFIETNVVGTYTLLDAVLNAWKKSTAIDISERRFHHVSTDEVYGSLSLDDAASTEQSPYQPNSPYSASKAASDHFVRAFFHTHQLPVSISNCSNNYGPYQFPEKFIPLAISRLLSKQAIPLYGDGMQIRDWLFVSDHCEAIWAVIERGRCGETYNVGGGNQHTNLAVAEAICEAFDERFPDPLGSYKKFIKHIADRPGHDRRYALDITKIRKDTGWYPLTDFSTGLRLTIEWMLQNSDWYREISRRDDFSNWMKTNYDRRAARS